MKKFACAGVLLLLTGCFGPETVDTTSDESLKESIQAVAKDLGPDKVPTFRKAVMYFTIGGSNGFKSLMQSSMAGDGARDAVVAANIQSIDGLTGEEVIERYQSEIANKKKIKGLAKKGQALSRKGDYSAAIEVYKGIADIPGGKKVSESGIEEIKAVKKGVEERTAYASQIEFSDFTANRTDTYLQEDVPSFKFTVKNTGDRALDLLGVTIYFKDSDGQVIYEKTYNIVEVKEYSFGRDNTPLKPGYVRESGVETLDVELKDWVPENTSLSLTSLRFTEPSQ